MKIEQKESSILLYGQAFELSDAWNDVTEWGGGWEDAPDPYRPVIVEIAPDEYGLGDITVSIEGEGKDAGMRAEFFHGEIEIDDFIEILEPEQFSWFADWFARYPDLDEILPPPPPTEPSYKMIPAVHRSDAPQGEPLFVRLGGMPRSRRSMNHRDDTHEIGVSAFHAVRTPDNGIFIVLDNMAQFATFLELHRPALILEGSVVGRGADGEPLLDADTVEATLIE